MDDKGEIASALKQIADELARCRRNLIEARDLLIAVEIATERVCELALTQTDDPVSDIR